MCPCFQCSCNASADTVDDHVLKLFDLITPHILLLLLLLTLFFGGISPITVPELAICTQHNICPYMVFRGHYLCWLQTTSRAPPTYDQVGFIILHTCVRADLDGKNVWWIWSWLLFFLMKKSFQNKLKRMSLDRTHWDIVGSQWPTSASNIFQCLLPWMCHCATLTDKPLLPQTSSSSSTGISLTLPRLKEKSDLALKEKFATSPLENLHFYCSLKENRFQTCRCLFCLAPCMCANQLFLWWTSTNQVTDHDWLDSWIWHVFIHTVCEY